MVYRKDVSAANRTEASQAAEEKFEGKYQVVIASGGQFFPPGDHYTICEKHDPQDGFVQKPRRPSRRHKILGFLHH